jgi:hypothetical protein
MHELAAGGAWLPPDKILRDSIASLSTAWHSAGVLLLGAVGEGYWIDAETVLLRQRSDFRGKSCQASRTRCR